ncbi:DNA-binding response regulator, OmpR family, contains REC and winged-helix (wHTH) domain [Dyadobacter koreensis]|uniref:DNA-binding response regulator, OmpR family, contains REC and winged-helix (WHTH) domain n=1 Tax=Dyadobacter koreensis TaxID=408657 RepID=A0A1H6RRT8_9BACT|nr:response regulator transcription factor [Dyadobacter koreensis]SEI55237.1 DNA-binding response regulator, OmpR family, contains REC and winged-helix (wHTH) domain [Dyadobacter koreensis]
MKNILIVEDDRRIAQNIYRGLHAENFEAEIAYDGITGKNLALSKKFDLILLDVNLPGLKGYDVCQQIRVYKPSLPIIMLTAYGEVEDKVEGLNKGANDYIVKPFDFRELMARIHAALRVSELNNPETESQVLRIADLELNIGTKEVIRAGKSIELTAKEFALLEYFLLHRGRVVSKMDLAEHVWHLNFDPGTNVVEVYINYLRKKIDKDFSTKLIHTRPGLGYIMKEE